MNRPIRNVAVAMLVLLTAMFVNLNFVQVVKGSYYRNHPDNHRVQLAEYSSPRGQIVVQGTAIATSKSTNDELKYLRTYPQGPEYAAVTGYYSFNYDTSAMENAENSVLSGHDDRLFASQLADLFTGRNPRGGSVELTLNKAAQLAAYKAMRSDNGTLRRGAVVALDPSTGAILAVVSTPSYDPNKLSTHNAESNTRYYNSLQPKQDEQNPANPLLNRAFNQLYAPGSVFKVVDAAAALKAGYKPDQRIAALNGFWPLDPKRTDRCPANQQGACVENFAGETCDNGTTATLQFALAKSCNTAFAQLVVRELGAKKVQDQAALFGFDQDQLDVPLGVTRSTVGTDADLADKAALAQTSFGQRDVRITPLQGAMIAATVANHGTLMEPYLVQKELRPDLSVLSETPPKQLAEVIDASQDEDLKAMMRAVVISPEGTGKPADITDIPGVTVGGKTGTADTGFCQVGTKVGPCTERAFRNGNLTPPHAWFAGYALQNGDPKIAVAVVIENGGVDGNEVTGGLAAAPVAKAVMEAYLKSGAGH